MTMTARIAALAVSIVLAGSHTARAETPAEFFKGKTLTIVIGTGMGASYGEYGQLVARHMGRHLPGAPSLIVQSMPGAGGLLALNYLAQRAPRDGSVLSVIHVTLVQEGLFNPRAAFKPGDYRWIGRLADIAFLGIASRKSGVKSLEDVRRREVVTGAPGPNNVPAQAPQVLNKIAGTRFKVVSGYKGNAEVLLALERGEVEMAVGTIATLRVTHWDKIENGELVPIYAQAGSRLKAFPNIPVLNEFGKSDGQKAFLNVFTATAEIGRALATPPGVPDDRLSALRSAFDKMVTDPAFKADAEKTRLDLDPKSGAEMRKFVDETLKMSDADREQARAFYNELFKK